MWGGNHLLSYALFWAAGSGAKRGLVYRAASWRLALRSGRFGKSPSRNLFYSLNNCVTRRFSGPRSKLKGARRYCYYTPMSDFCQDQGGHSGAFPKWLPAPAGSQTPPAGRSGVTDPTLRLPDVGQSSSGRPAGRGDLWYNEFAYSGMAHGGRATSGEGLHSGRTIRHEVIMGHADHSRYLFSSFSQRARGLGPPLALLIGYWIGEICQSGRCVVKCDSFVNRSGSVERQVKRTTQRAYRAPAGEGSPARCPFFSGTGVETGARHFESAWHLFGR